MGGRSSKSNFSGNQNETRHRGGIGSENDMWGEGKGDAVSLDEWDSHIRRVSARTGVNPIEAEANEVMLRSNWGQPRAYDRQIAQSAQADAYRLANEAGKIPFGGTDDIYTATKMGTREAREGTSAFVDKYAAEKGISHGKAFREIRDKQIEAIERRKKLGELFDGNNNKIARDSDVWRRFSGIGLDNTGETAARSLKLFKDYANGKIDQKGFVKEAKKMRDVAERGYPEKTLIKYYGLEKVRALENQYGGKWADHLHDDE